MTNFNQFPDEPRFIWVIKNVQPTLVVINGLGQKGLYIRSGSQIALHELFPWHKLVESEGLRTAIQHGLVEVLDKRVLSPVEVGKISVQENKELTELKEQILALKESIDSRPNETKIEQQTIDSEDIKSELRKEMESLKKSINSNKNHQTKFAEVPTIDHEALSKHISDSVTACMTDNLSTLLQSFQGVHLAGKEFKLDGYIERKPEDVITDGLIRDDRTISGSATAGIKQNIKEDIIYSSVIDNADLLSQL